MTEGDGARWRCLVLIRVITLEPGPPEEAHVQSVAYLFAHFPNHGYTLISKGRIANQQKARETTAKALEEVLGKRLPSRRRFRWESDGQISHLYVCDIMRGDWEWLQRPNSSAVACLSTDDFYRTVREGAFDRKMFDVLVERALVLPFGRDQNSQPPAMV